ncbi:peptide/nickel transport system permease protein [Nocardia bhagyanarayanae]|uniref:Peptide/nickel transport system permease protein n=1 Tax=Nocardia bhagyanarayanae TaxID=1215925 RepID=A0A543F575_9NOCA|nr:peptide/nickel transport system permease protein [Nocardia bhagyanarayanae]
MTAPELVTEPTAVLAPSRRGRFGLRLFSMTAGMQRVTLILGLVLIAGFLFVALFAPLLAPYGLAQTTENGVGFGQYQPPSAQHWFGTTVAQEDVFSRVLYGARTALWVIVVSLVLSLFVGVPLGLVSGYVGRWLDRVLVTVMDALYAFPTLLLAIVVSIVVSGGESSGFGGVLSAAVAITTIFVPQYFRVVRNATVAVKQEPYVDAARVTGASTVRILFRHILANVTQSLPVIVTLNGAEAILTLAGLGFLGFGIESTQAAEWGFDLNKSLAAVSNGIWWTAVFPGTAIVLVVLGMTLVGESLNEVLNPLLRTRRTAAPVAVGSDVVVGATGEPEMPVAEDGSDVDPAVDGALSAPDGRSVESDGGAGSAPDSAPVRSDGGTESVPEGVSVVPDGDAGSVPGHDLVGSDGDAGHAPDGDPVEADEGAGAAPDGDPVVPKGSAEQVAGDNVSSRREGGHA